MAQFRPTVWTFANRLAWTVPAAVLLVPVCTFYMTLAGQPPPRTTARPTVPPEMPAQANAILEDMRREMAPEAWQRLQDDLAQKEADRQARRADYDNRFARNRALLLNGLIAVGSLLALVGILPPLSVVWNRVTLQHSPRGVEILTWHLFPKRRTYAPGAIGRIDVIAREHVTRSRHTRIILRGWRWHVRLYPPLVADSLPGSAFVEFIAGRQADRPVEGDSPPPDVRAFLGELSRLTGVQPEVPVVAETSLEMGLLGPRVVQRARLRSGNPVVQRHETRETYRSLDEVPENLRPQVERLLRKAKDSGAPQQERFVYHDSDGRELVFRSPDEMPPEIRAIFEQMRRQGQ